MDRSFRGRDPAASGLVDLVDPDHGVERDENPAHTLELALQSGSGTYLTARILLEVADVKPRDIVAIGTDEALAQLKQGRIDAMFYVAGLPVRLFSEAVKPEDKLALLPITNKSIQHFYQPVQIPAKTYGWQDQEINTVAVKAVLVAYDFRGNTCDHVGKLAKSLQDISNG